MSKQTSHSDPLQEIPPTFNIIGGSIHIHFIYTRASATHKLLLLGTSKHATNELLRDTTRQSSWRRLYNPLLMPSYDIVFNS